MSIPTLSVIIHSCHLHMIHYASIVQSNSPQGVLKGDCCVEDIFLHIICTIMALTNITLSDGVLMEILMIWYSCLWSFGFRYTTEIILCMRPANERRRYIVMSSAIGWMHTQNDACTVRFCCSMVQIIMNIYEHSTAMTEIENRSDFNTLRPRQKMATFFQTTFSNTFSWMKMYEFCLRFHWNLFLRFELTIFQHWFR